MNIVKILIVLANQSEPGEARLYLDKEIRAIKQRIQSAKYRDLIVIDTLEAATFADLISKINQYEPDVLHFSGHGTRKGDLVFCSDSGKEHFVNEANLLKLFEIAAPTVKIGFFSACFSERIADMVVHSVPCAIGMRTEINDDVATTFSSHFYQALASAKDIQNAFLQAKLSLGVGIGIDESEIVEAEKAPQLRTKKGIDPKNFVLVSRDPQ